MEPKKWFFAMLLFSALATAACQQRPYGRSMGYGDHMMGYYGYGGALMWLLVLILVGVALYFLITFKRQSGFMDRGPGETPLDILKKRYARGEITKDEFDQLKKDIES